jgi:nitrogen fixation/metabolism regulation signal transduction histidine kinase
VESVPLHAAPKIVLLLAIPATLAACLLVSVGNLALDLARKRPGAKIQLRLAGFFALVALLASLPVLLITANGVNRFLSYWRAIDVADVLQDAQEQALELYSFKLDSFKRMLDTPALLQKASARLRGGDGDAAPLVAAQTFVWNDNSWENADFRGSSDTFLAMPPGAGTNGKNLREGFSDRVLPRDIDVIRYVTVRKDRAFVYTFTLGEGFDQSITRLQSESSRFSRLRAVEPRMFSVLFLFFAVFLLPTLLMTVIIALSFTREITAPIVDIADATRKVAAGDFSLHLRSREKDELGQLVRSFNMMVENLEKSRLALLNAEKISVWQDMAQRLAHEIKNPLTPIKLSAERVLRRWRNEPERTGEIIESSMLAIIQEVENLSGLVSEFRELSRPLAPTESFCNLREAVNADIEPYRQSYPNVTLSTDGIAADIEARIEKKQLSQIVSNLVSNAIDAMDGKGVITLKTDWFVKRDAPFVRLSIGDTGVGMSTEVAAQIFTPYFTTKEHGTGLGLVIARRIITELGGAIRVNSAPGAGTTFLVDLPARMSASIPSR